MTAQELREILKSSEDKLSLFIDMDKIKQFNFSWKNLYDLISEFLTDEQKAKLLEIEFYHKDKDIRKGIISCISDDKIIMKLLEDERMTSEFNQYDIMNIIKPLSNDLKKIFLKSDLIKKHNFSEYILVDILTSLDEESRKELLNDSEYIKDFLHFETYNIKKIILSFESEQTKEDLINICGSILDNFEIREIVETYTDESKMTILYTNKYGFNGYDIAQLCASLSIDYLLNLFRNNRNFLDENNIKPYQIIEWLNKEKQLKIISKIEEMNLSIDDKRKIFFILKEETKKEFDRKNLPLEYLTAMDMQVEENDSDISTNGKIIVDFSEDLEKYRGLDEFIYLNPLDIPEENTPKIEELLKICPSIVIKDNIKMLGKSTAQEYLRAENWIKSVLEGMNEKWTNIQKVAYIDDAIGKKISYSPDFDTEIFDAGSARSLWKIIDSGYGVCNGIAQVEYYMLKKIGIQSEMISSKTHTFLKLKDIDLPTKNGEIVQGNTIIDPTWNLTAHCYGAYPNNFCKSYKEIRKNDITTDGTDLECHKNDEELADATFELDEANLRKIYNSIGLTDKEGNFLIKGYIEKCKYIDDLGLPPEESLNKQLELFTKSYPNFAKSINSTMSIISSVVLNQKNLNFNRCVVNRVYAKDDSNKRPVLYVYVDLPEAGKKFYYANKELAQFTELSQKEFEEKFECYVLDMEKRNGHRPWEEVEMKEKEDLTRSSGKITAVEGDER